jgi:hypothetical protein
MMKDISSSSNNFQRASPNFLLKRSRGREFHRAYAPITQRFLDPVAGISFDGDGK